MEPSIITEFGSIRWRGHTYAVPDAHTLEMWAFDTVCETPDGETVEHDHPDSWLSLLGMV